MAEETHEEEEAETMEQCIARHMAANEELTEEQARAKCEEERKPPAEEKAFMDKLMAVFNEAIDLKMQDFWKKVEKRMEEAVTRVQDQAVQGLRKGLGISEDPVIHVSELPELVRKTLLDLQPPGKRTETETVEKPSAGAEKPRIPKATDRFNEIMKEKGRF